MNSRAFITGVSGLKLTDSERDFIRSERPWGFILFGRNVETPTQVAALVGELRAAGESPDAPILIDQEGGRVQRLGPPLWPSFPPAATFGALYARDPEAGKNAARLGARLIANELLALGITADCLPVADLRRPEGHGIIGDRAYGETVEAVAELARAAAEGLMEGGVLPVVKHIPGHGRANADSHEALPSVAASLKELEETDFEPFRRLNDLPMAMTAHVLYTALDPQFAAPISRKIVGNIIRGHIGFDGLLMTDDLSMKALEGSLPERAEKAFQAGCDVALHCNGNLDEMIQIAAVCPPLSGDAARRAEAARKRRKSPLDNMNLAEARGRFSAMLTA